MTVSCRRPPASHLPVADAVTATLAELADPAPVVPAPDWSAALCAQADPEAWFPFPETDSGSRDAKRVCHRCDIEAECLAWAVATDQRFGVWGGLSTRQRRWLRRPAEGVAS